MLTDADLDQMIADTTEPNLRAALEELRAWRKRVAKPAGYCDGDGMDMGNTLDEVRETMDHDFSSCFIDLYPYAMLPKQTYQYEWDEEECEGTLTGPVTPPARGEE